ncbi:AraC family transcriptional regulator [Terrimonas sp. NA20]|uniref:AraC family transcriptional regulator n=1 Tax=Terrimonas ginsenosidimutans TaxID=2908004 RepID=A0ABS9KLB0_9BACT|nr:AraC family transcriptional regulator [Terrimonas ginsenosidimutans]MCG2613104.1 AraC family transcriptional regulator [Terrimonas ginsenosidimutans]
MIPELTLSGGQTVQLVASSLRKFKGARLPGSNYWCAEGTAFAADFQEYDQPDFRISYRIFQTFKNAQLSFSIKEDSDRWRIEIMLDGTAQVNDLQNGGTTIRAGQYRVTKDNVSVFNISPDARCRYLSASMIMDEADAIQIGKTAGQIMTLPAGMQRLCSDLLFNKYQPTLHNFYYENSVRELFFSHLSLQPSSYDHLSAAELNAVYEADRIIRENLLQHFSIQDLARKTGTNEFKLKKDFRSVFHVGMFGHLMNLRMQYALELLETTPILIKDIAEKAGYETVAGFITAFRKKYGLPPGEWRTNKPDNY